MDTRLLTEGELSDKTGLPRDWLREQTQAGRIPFLNVGRRRRFDIDSVRRALAEIADEERRRVSKAETVGGAA